MAFNELVNALVTVAVVVSGGLAIVRAFTGKEYFLRALGSRHVGPRVANWLARPALFLMGIAAWVLVYCFWRQG